MKRSILIVALGVAVAITGMTAGATWAQDALTVINQRQDTMKALGRANAAVRAYTEDKADLAAAQAGGAELAKTIPTIPTLFPQGTGMAEFPGTSYAKPEIWTQWDQFNEAVQRATTRANELNAALQSGDKAAVTAAFAAMGKDGCTGCHTPFRERKS
jgi:cytochrome c556